MRLDKANQENGTKNRDKTIRSLISPAPIPNLRRSGIKAKTVKNENGFICSPEMALSAEKREAQARIVRLVIRWWRKSTAEI
jgi:hypothetical protein